MAHKVQTISESPVATAVVSTVIEMGGGHACYASPKVVVSALLEALWSVYSNAHTADRADDSARAAPLSQRA